MAISVPREVVFGVVLIGIQLIYSQVYPLLTGGGAGSDTGDSTADILSSSFSPSIPEFAPAESPRAPEPPVPAEPLPEASGSRVEKPAAERERHQREKKPKEERGEKENESDYFAGSTAPRSRPRKGGPKFRIGEFVRDNIMLVRGVVIGWDATCQAPGWWKKARLASPSWASAPGYLILVDFRDVENLGEEPTAGEARMSNFTLYSPEATLEKLGKDGNPILNPMMNQFFNLFDTSLGTYLPTPQIARRYADDLHRHYRNKLDRLPEVDPHGKPLLRIVEFGRMIAHGKSVPVVRKGMFLVSTPELQDEFMFGKTAILLLEHDDNDGTLGVIVNKNITGSKRKAMAQSAEQNIEQMQTFMQQQEKSGGDEQMLKTIANEVEQASGVLKLARAPFVDLRIGGPVGLQQFPSGPHHLLLHPFKDAHGAKLALRGAGSKADPDLYVTRLHGLSPKKIKDFIKRNAQLSPEARAAGQRMIVFAGNSAWGPKQLAGEIRGSLQGSSSWGWMPATTRNVLTLDKKSDLKFWKALRNSSALQHLEDT
mmetsp:Transcript_146027/g.266063  ORF Transcript_146027/g.266063 Transcript_146027/m.266063 type:complete len:541 (-) Transcript_146027:89-1711(-)